jgi:hypothetical protein
VILKENTKYSLCFVKSVKPSQLSVVLCFQDGGNPKGEVRLPVSKRPPKPVIWKGTY